MHGGLCYFSAVFSTGASRPMALFTTEALVLRGYKLGETSKVVVLLTRERGKVRAVARGASGARPRYRSALEPLSEVRVSLHGRQGAELLRLGQAELLHSAFRAGGRSLDAALFLSGCAELLDAFCPRARPRTGSTGWPSPRCAPPRAGASPELLGPLPGGLAAEAERALPAARPLRGLRGGAPGDRLALATTARRTGSCATTAGPPRVRCCRARRAPARVVLQLAARHARGRGPGRASVEAFHRELIAAHLERDLRAPRVIREITREAAR